MKRSMSQMQVCAEWLEITGFVALCIAAMGLLLMAVGCSSEALMRTASTVEVGVGRGEGAVGARDYDAESAWVSVRPLAALEPPTRVRIDPPPIAQPALSWELVPRLDDLPGGAGPTKAGQGAATVEPPPPPTPWYESVALWSGLVALLGAAGSIWSKAATGSWVPPAMTDVFSKGTKQAPKEGDQA